MAKNTKIALIIGGIALILLIWGILAKSNKNNISTFTPTSTTENTLAATSTPENSTTTITATSTLPATTTKKVIKPKTVIKTPAPSYSDIVKKYAGYRFQFSGNCSYVTPVSFVIKKGYKFMADNRENKKHTFTFGSQKYTVAPYGYAIFTATTVGKQMILCDGIQRGSVNVAP
jgi:hypothetical protein